MPNSMWKFAALAGVMSVGFFVLFEVQKSLGLSWDPNQKAISLEDYAEKAETPVNTTPVSHPAGTGGEVIAANESDSREQVPIQPRRQPNQGASPQETSPAGNPFAGMFSPTENSSSTTTNTGTIPEPQNTADPNAMSWQPEVTPVAFSEEQPVQEQPAGNPFGTPTAQEQESANENEKQDIQQLFPVNSLEPEQPKAVEVAAPNLFAAESVEQPTQSQPEAVESNPFANMSFGPTPEAETVPIKEPEAPVETNPFAADAFVAEKPASAEQPVEESVTSLFPEQTEPVPAETVPVKPVANEEADPLANVLNSPAAKDVANHLNVDVETSVGSNAPEPQDVNSNPSGVMPAGNGGAQSGPSLEPIARPLPESENVAENSPAEAADVPVDFNASEPQPSDGVISAPTLVAPEENSVPVGNPFGAEPIQTPAAEPEMESENPFGNFAEQPEAANESFLTDKPATAWPAEPAPAEAAPLETEEPAPTMQFGPQTGSTYEREEDPVAQPDPTKKIQILPAGGQENREPNLLRNAVGNTANDADPAKDVKLLSDQLVGDATVTDETLTETLQPELKLEKKAPPTAAIGQPLIYSILVRNIGKVDADQVTVKDRIPKGTRLTGTIPRARLSDKTLSWELGKVKAGEEKLIRVRVIPTDEGEVGSVTTVSFVTEVAAETRITSPKLKLNIDGPTQAVLGEDVVLKFRVTNIGSGQATNVVLHDLLPPELSHPVDRDLVYEVGTIAPGQTRETTLVVKAEKAGKVINRASLVSKEGVKTDAEINFEIIESILTVSRKGPARRFVGHKSTYSIEVQNESIRKIENATVTEVVPAGMSFVSATSGGRYDPVNRAVIWTGLQLNPDDEQVVQVTLLPEAVGTHTSQVEVVDQTGHKASLSSTTKVEGFASLGISVDEGRAPTGIGEQVSLRFFVKNRGSAESTNVQFSCQVPQQLQFINAKGPTRFRQVGRMLVFEPIAKLAPDAEHAFDVVLNAVSPGDTHLKISVSSDQQKKALSHDESVIVYDPSN